MKRDKIIEGSKLIADYMGNSNNFSEYYYSLDALLPAIEKLEKEDLSDWHYEWEEYGKTRNNFMRISFTTYMGGCFSEVELNLDPSIQIAKSFEEDLNLIQNTFNVVVETVKYINKIKEDEI